MPVAQRAPQPVDAASRAALPPEAYRQAVDQAEKKM